MDCKPRICVPLESKLVVRLEHDCLVNLDFLILFTFPHGSKERGYENRGGVGKANSLLQAKIRPLRLEKRFRKR